MVVCLQKLYLRDRDPAPRILAKFIDCVAKLPLDIILSIWKIINKKIIIIYCKFLNSIHLLHYINCILDCVSLSMKHETML